MLTFIVAFSLQMPLISQQFIFEPQHNLFAFVIVFLAHTPNLT